VACAESAGGSAPASLRNAFLNLIDDDAQGEEACRLAERLVECTDVLPLEYCDMLALAEGSTFGQAARLVRANLGCEST
jgi:hypothetical protein